MEHLTEQSTGEIGARISSLADHIAGRGIPVSERWRQALLEVPRHLFVPATGWACPDCPGVSGHLIDAGTDPGGWWDAVYSDSSIITQRDDGATGAQEVRGVPTSAISAPGIVLAFLDLLDVHDHHRVLDIGTGSGWTAALLSWRAGANNVTSIEIDKAVAAGAAANLEGAGYLPHLVTGDGSDGFPGNAPYDRIHVTCSVERVPHAWLTQCRPGGVIAFPWSGDFHCGQMVRLDVLTGNMAVGRFHGPASYMMIRSQRRDLTWAPRHADGAGHRRTGLDPRSVMNCDPGAHAAIAAMVPGTVLRPVSGENGEFSLFLFEPGEGNAWAACDYVPGADDFEVTQHGSRRLWDEVATAYLQWVSWGRPELARFGLTVTGDSQHVWLDSPANVIDPQLPG